MKDNREGVDTQLWKTNTLKSMKNGIRNKVYWVKENTKIEGGFTKKEWNINNTYQGTWKDNKKFGFGIQNFSNGDKYEGEWEDNKQHGYGTLWVKRANGNLVRSYTGQFYLGYKHGKGTMFFENGDQYEGNWKVNEMSGFGRINYKNGDSYVGHWSNNQRNGYGILNKQNGDCFEGNWLNNEREGYGSHYFKDNKKVIIGEWVGDIPKASVMYRLDSINENENSDNVNLLKEMGNNQDDKIKIDSIALPKLKLESPVEVLEEAIREIRADRQIFRIINSCTECLMTEEELQEYLTKFENIALGNNTVTINDLYKIVEEYSMEDVKKAFNLIVNNSELITFDSMIKIIVLLENNSY